MCRTSGRAGWLLATAGALGIAASAAAQSYTWPATKPAEPSSPSPYGGATGPASQTGGVPAGQTPGWPAAKSTAAYPSMPASPLPGVMAVPPGTAKPATAAPGTPPVVSSPLSRSVEQWQRRTSSGAMTTTADDFARLAETKVLLAWLGDPLTASAPLRARASGGTLKVYGNVPNETARIQAMKVAAENCALPLLDSMTIRAGAAAVTKKESTDQLCRSCAEAMSQGLGKAVYDFKIQADPNGKVTVSGTAPSYEEKLAVSERLRLVRGCSCVDNQLKVWNMTYQGKEYCLVTADGRHIVPAEAVAKASSSPAGISPVSLSTAPAKPTILPPVSKDVPLAARDGKTVPANMASKEPTIPMAKKSQGNKTTKTSRTVAVGTKTGTPTADASPLATSGPMTTTGQMSAGQGETVQKTEQPASESKKAKPPVKKSLVARLLSKNKPVAQAATIQKPGTSAPVATPTPSARPNAGSQSVTSGQSPTVAAAAKPLTWPPNVPQAADPFAVAQAKVETPKTADPFKPSAPLAAKPLTWPPIGQQTSAPAVTTRAGSVSDGVSPIGQQTSAPTVTTRAGSVSDGVSPIGQQTSAPTVTAQAKVETAKPADSFKPSVTAATTVWQAQPASTAAKAASASAGKNQVAQASGPAGPKGMTGSKSSARSSPVKQAVYQEKSGEADSAAVTSGVMVLTSATESPQTTSVAATAHLQHWLKQVIERSCGQEARDVDVVFLLHSNTNMLVNMKVHDAEAAQHLAAKIMQLSELKPYQVFLEVHVLP